MVTDITTSPGTSPTLPTVSASGGDAVSVLQMLLSNSRAQSDIMNEPAANSDIETISSLSRLSTPTITPTAIVVSTPNTDNMLTELFDPYHSELKIEKEIWEKRIQDNGDKK